MAGAFVSHAWLAAVVPARARRFRVSDSRLEYTLRAAGAELVRGDADVEIGDVDDLAGEAQTAIVPVNGNITDSHARVQQVVRRVAASARARFQTAHARATLERRGYAHVSVVPWDRDQPIHLDGGRFDGHSVAERFPRRALVVANRAQPSPTILEQALDDAGQQLSMPLDIVRPLVGSGTLVILTADHVLRIALGPATDVIEQQANVLGALASAAAPTVAALVPRIDGRGRTGLAHWSVERRVRGAHPASLIPSVAADCLEFLVALRTTAPVGTPAPAIASPDQAEFVGSFVPSVASMVRALGGEIDEQTRGLRGGFWHGDMWARNLFVVDDRLSGVIDWAQGGPGGLPLLDLLNMEMVATPYAGVYGWGPSIIERLVPLAARGPTGASREYLHRTGLDVTTRQYEALIAAYWLERVSHDLATYLDRGIDRLWLQRNVAEVAPALLAMVSAPAAFRRPA